MKTALGSDMLPMSDQWFSLWISGRNHYQLTTLKMPIIHMTALGPSMCHMTKTNIHIIHVHQHLESTSP